MNSPGQIKNNSPKQQAAAPERKRSRSALGFVFSPDLGNSVKPIKDNFRFFRATIAILFLTSGTLDRTHPFFAPDARFTIMDLFYETYARFDWKDRSKMPQNIFFLAVWGLLSLSVLWLLTAVLYFVAGAGVARAADAPVAETSTAIFSILPNDLATHFINNLIEGTPIPGVGERGAADYRPPGPLTGMIQEALRGMLAFYSSAVLAFASFLLMYHVINLVVQAAWSGKAFEGAAQIWAPLRLVLAICLLVPLSSGLNSAQLLTLGIAKLGSGIATRAWQGFGNVLTNQNNVSAAGMASIRGVEEPVRRMMIVYGCMADVNLQIANTTDAVQDIATGAATIGATILGGLAGGIFGAAAAGGVTHMMLDNTIVEKPNDDNPENERLVSVGAFRNPNLCGLISMPLSDSLRRQAAVAAATTLANATGGDPAAAETAINDAATAETARQSPVDRMRKTIQNSIGDASETLRSEVKVAAACMAAMNRAIKDGSAYKTSYETLCKTTGITTVEFDDIGTGDDVRNGIITKVGAAVRAYYATVKTTIETASAALSRQNTIGQSSWVEAGAYFARVSATQYAIMSASSASPKSAYGNLMAGYNGGSREIGDRLQSGTRASEADAAQNGGERGGGALFGLSSEQNNYFNHMLTTHADFVLGEGPFLVALKNTNRPTPTTIDASGAVAPGGPVEFLRDGFGGADKQSLIRVMMGDGINDPILALFNFGYGVFQFALWMFALGIGSSLASLIPGISGAASGLANVAFLLGFIMMNVSFPLVFLLPILPLVRFLAGVMSWLIGLFEAVVSMPLFALAHLNPSGNTLFEPARQGYHYLLHIALKPLLLVFGMIGAIIILPIILYALNIMYGTALDTMWGDNVGPIEKAMFFMAYATSAYGFVNIAFRAIDDLSRNAMGWGNFQSYNFRDDSERVGTDMAAVAQYVTSWGKDLGSAAGGLKRGVQQDVSAGLQKNREKKKEAIKAYTDAESDKTIEPGKGRRGGLGGLVLGGLPGYASGGVKPGSAQFTKEHRDALKDKGATDAQINKKQGLMQRGERLSKRMGGMDRLNDKEQTQVAEQRAGIAAKHQQSEAQGEQRAAQQAQEAKALALTALSEAKSGKQHPMTAADAAKAETGLKSLTAGERSENGISDADVTRLQDRIDKTKK